MRGHFSYSFNERNEVMHYTKKTAKTVLATYFIIILRRRKPFHVNTLKIADNRLKNHDINSDKTSTDKGKNTRKKQVCNQQ